MPQATREIKRRIRSIKNTRQITRAMELVSAAKMRKAVHNVLASRAYAKEAWTLVSELSARTETKHHPLLERRQTEKKIGVLLVSSNRGLCGGFNYQLAQKVENYLKSLPLEADVKIISFGARARDVMLRQNRTIVADFNKPEVVGSLETIKPIAEMLLQDYLAGTYDKIVLAYTDFISALSQKPRIKQLLPIEPELVKESESHGVRKSAQFASNYEYVFEPNPAEVLNDLLPRLLEMQMYQTVLESDASEHSARMLAMRNASIAARDMIDDLNLTYNQARQASITGELADITGGRAAIEAV